MPATDGSCSGDGRELLRICNRTAGGGLVTVVCRYSRYGTPNRTSAAVVMLVALAMVGTAYAPRTATTRRCTRRRAGASGGNASAGASLRLCSTAGWRSTRGMLPDARLCIWRQADTCPVSWWSFCGAVRTWTRATMSVGPHSTWPHGMTLSALEKSRWSSLQRGAEVDAVDAGGTTPLEVAEDRGRTESVTLLRRWRGAGIETTQRRAAGVRVEVTASSVLRFFGPHSFPDPEDLACVEATPFGPFFERGRNEELTIRLVPDLSLGLHENNSSWWWGMDGRGMADPWAALQRFARGTVEFYRGAHLLAGVRTSEWTRLDGVLQVRGAAPDLHGRTVALAGGTLDWTHGVLPAVSVERRAGSSALRCCGRPANLG